MFLDLKFLGESLFLVPFFLSPWRDKPIGFFSNPHFFGNNCELRKVVGENISKSYGGGQKFRKFCGWRKVLMLQVLKTDCEFDVILYYPQMVPLGYNLILFLFYIVPYKTLFLISIYRRNLVFFFPLKFVIPRRRTNVSDPLWGPNMILLPFYIFQQKTFFNWNLQEEFRNFDHLKFRCWPTLSCPVRFTLVGNPQNQD